MWSNQTCTVTEQSESLYVVGKSFASYLSDTGVHKIENCIKNRFHCVSLESLLDLYPLEVYSLPAGDVLALKHTV